MSGSWMAGDERARRKLKPLTNAAKQHQSEPVFGAGQRRKLVCGTLGTKDQPRRRSVIHQPLRSKP